MNTDKIDRLFKIWLHSSSQMIEFEKAFPLEDGQKYELRERYLPDLFDTINTFYWHSFLITITKLLEPHSQGKNKTNLTLFTLLEVYNASEDFPLDELELRLKKLKKKIDCIKKYRDKVLAHIDNDYALSLKEFNSSTSIEDVKFFFNEMFELINLTLKSFGLSGKSGLIIGRADFRGVESLYNILQYYDREVNKEI